MLNSFSYSGIVQSLRSNMATFLCGCTYIIYLGLVGALKVTHNTKAVYLNRLDTIAYNCPHTYMVYRNISDTILLPDTFEQCKSLIILDLSHNKIIQILPGAFDDISQLIELHLAYNKITEIAYGTFYTLTKLKLLVLSGNKLKTIPDFEFTSNQMRTVYFDHNRINHSEPIALNNLRLVELLDLSFNQLVEFSRSTLMNLQPGAIINLNHNKLKNASIILKTSIATNRLYSYLHMMNNSLDDLTSTTLGDFYKLNIHTLDVSYNSICSVEPSAIGQYRSLKILRLRHNKIQFLDEAVFKNNVNLEFLDLSFNKIRNIAFLLQVPNFIKVNLRSNQIGPSIDFLLISFSYKQIAFVNFDLNNISYMDINFNDININRFSLNKNDWKCPVLYDLIRNLEMHKIKVDRGWTYDDENINGIKCTRN